MGSSPIPATNLRTGFGQFPKAALGNRDAELARLGAGIASAPAPFDFSVFDFEPFHGDQLVGLAGRLMAECRRSKGSRLRVSRGDDIAFSNQPFELELHAIAFDKLPPNGLDLIEEAFAHHSLNLCVFGQEFL